MNKTIFSIIAILFFSTTIAQKEKMTLIKIGVLENSMMLPDGLKELFEKKYRKTIYKGDMNIFFVNVNSRRTEIVEYDMDKSFKRFFFLENDSIYKVPDYVYEDINLGELTGQQKDYLKSMFSIYRDSTKIINGFKCFQVTMKSPEDKSLTIKMYVTEEIPNLPNHFPLPSNILNAEPLECENYALGNQIKIGITEFDKNRNIEKDLKFSFDDAIEVPLSQYANE